MAAFTAITQQPPRVAAFARRSPTDANRFNTKIYQLANNCRTSVEIIEKYHAAHIKNTLDTSAINRRRPRRKGELQAPDLHTDE